MRVRPQSDHPEPAPRDIDSSAPRTQLQPGAFGACAARGRAILAKLRALAERLLGAAGRVAVASRDADALLVLTPREITRVTVAGPPTPIGARPRLVSSRPMPIGTTDATPTPSAAGAVAGRRPAAQLRLVG